MLLSDKSKTNRYYELSREFKYDPAREQELAKLQASKHEAKVFEFEKMGRYEQISRPHVGQEKRNMIEEKLELDKKAEVQANKRIKKDNLIVKYDRNPFVETGYRARFAQRFQKFDYGTKEGAERDAEADFAERNIVEAVNSLSQRNFPKFKNPDRWNEVGNISQTTLKQMMKPSKAKGSTAEQQSEREQSSELSFDEILEMQEESYYIKNQIPINIFQFFKGNHKSFLTNSILDKFYFCHISMMDKITTIRFPLVRDISKVGRKFASDHLYTQPSRLDNITSNQISFKVGDIKFIDLLSVASGRFNPEIVYKAANEIQVRDDSSSIKSEINQPEIDYKQHMRQQATAFESDNIGSLQIRDYLKLQHTMAQQKYENKCNKVYREVERQMQKKARLTGDTVRDKQLHKEIDNNVNQCLEYLNNIDPKLEETQKFIRRNKVSKNRNEAIKIRTLLNSIVLKNRQEEKIKILLDDK